MAKMARKLEKVAAGTKSEDSALDIIKRLSSMDVTIDILQVHSLPVATLKKSREIVGCRKRGWG